MNPDRQCNFDCVYCEVNRQAPVRDTALDVDAMALELERMLAFVEQGRVRECHDYAALPAELLRLSQVALSGDGEPTLCPNFIEAVQTVVHLRARGRFPFFKVVLITNASGLDRPEVQEGLKYLTRQDEIWAKLDVGTQAYMDLINRPQASLGKILSNILLVARQRPVIIQSLFTQLGGAEPPPEEIEAYATRLKELKSAGAQIPLVQIYSATRPTHSPDCGHLPLRLLSRIAQQVRDLSGLKAEVF
jgi:wyosine [tRNA(Phe)-imidazoG37] synthetase (radical SAM superfamily)